METLAVRVVKGFIMATFFFIPVLVFGNVLFESSNTGTAYNVSSYVFVNNLYMRLPFSTSTYQFPTDMSYTLTAPIETLRLKRISGVDCSVPMNINLITSQGNALGVVKMGVTNGNYCDFPVINTQIGDTFGAIALCVTNGCNNAAGDLVLDGSPTNIGYSFDGYGNNASPGGVAFQLCDASGCSGGFHDATATPLICVIDCYSNVMFFPGIMGSRLYENTGSENELWVSASDAAQAKLSMDTQGKSVNQIYTKDDTKNNGETDETGVVDDVYGFNIYQSFIADLKDWKSQGIIKDYDFIPYDWRLAPEQIVTQSTTTAGNITYGGSQNLQDSYVVKKLQELVDSSKSGKVTIIAHSNGGLVVKALVQKLKDANSPLYDKIDKIIFVAVPQVGTPDAIMGLLHGSDIGYGFIMSAERMRMLAENMPAIYNLLPSSAYFTTVSPTFAVDKVVSFENDPLFNMQVSQYGMFVSNSSELKNYLLGSEGRMRPTFSDLVNANIGNQVVYTQAESFHQAYDTWQPAPSTKVIQVAGWGVDTIAGIDYETVAAPNNQRRATYKPRFVVDGDGTVVVPSALWMSTSTPNVERWWVDLQTHNAGSLIGTKHRDILEIPELLDFIKSEISGNPVSDSIVMNDNSVLNAGGQRLHFTLHSPLTLGVTDVQGRYTGLDPISKKVREEIPNVSYKRFGDIQVISSPSNLNLKLGLQGYASGNFALDIEKQQGNSIIESTSYQGIPSSTSTSARIDIAADQDIASTSLQVDQNSDGTIDKVLQGVSGAVVIYDTSAPEISVTFSTTSRDVIFSGLDDSPVTTTQTSTSTIVTDSQGNTSVLKFTKYKEKNTKLKFAFNSITRNGVVTQLPNISVEYDWSVKNDMLTDLDTKVIIKGIERYKFEYKKTTNTTVITDKTGKSEKKVSKKGFVPVSITTIVNEVKVVY
jgi:pimeloyl-ACP methyl ester carboxylesterase